MERRVYTVKETLQQLPISRSYLYDLMDRGEIRRVKVGRRTLIEATEIEKFLDRIIQESHP